MEGSGSFSNFGDGPAHRVSVYIHRGDAKLSQMLGTSPLVKPGDSIEFSFGVLAQHFDDTYLWVTWTPPPIRRRLEQTSARVLLPDHTELSDIAKDKLQEFQRKREVEAKPDKPAE